MLRAGVAVMLVGVIWATAGPGDVFATTATTKLITMQAAIASSETATGQSEGLLPRCTIMTSLWIDLVLDVSAAWNALRRPGVAVKPTVKLNIACVRRVIGAGA